MINMRGQLPVQRAHAPSERLQCGKHAPARRPSAIAARRMMDEKVRVRMGRAHRSELQTQQRDEKESCPQEEMLPRPDKMPAAKRDLVRRLVLPRTSSPWGARAPLTALAAWVTKTVPSTVYRITPYHL